MSETDTPAALARTVIRTRAAAPRTQAQRQASGGVSGFDPFYDLIFLIFRELCNGQKRQHVSG